MKDISISPPDWGHWYIEYGSELGYGWYPGPIDNPLFPVDGVLNNGLDTEPYTLGGPNKKAGTREYQAYGNISKKAALNRIHSFAKSYSGNWSWPYGQNCRTFIQQLLDHTGLTIKYVKTH